MREITKRLERLEAESRPAGGKLLLVSWHSPNDSAECREAKRGEERIERRLEETEAAFLARLRADYTPASGVACMFMERR